MQPPRQLILTGAVVGLLLSLVGCSATGGVTTTVVVDPTVTHTIEDAPVTRTAVTKIEVTTCTKTTTITTCVSSFARVSSNIDVQSQLEPLVIRTVTVTSTNQNAATTVTKTINVAPTITEQATTTTMQRIKTVYATSTAYFANPQGFQWAYQYNDNGNNNDSTYPSWEPSSFQTEPPLSNGTIPTLQYIHDTCSSGKTAIYANYVDCNFFGLNHRGYLYIPKTGTYKFKFEYRDDVVDVWIGDRAYSGYDRANALITETYPGNSIPSQFTISLTGGSYLPIRVIFGQAEFGYSFSLVVEDPDGNAVIGGAAPSSELIQYSCNPADNAPIFPPYGAEE